MEVGEKVCLSSSHLTLMRNILLSAAAAAGQVPPPTLADA